MKEELKNDHVDQEIISDQAYHNWKQHDCTKALLQVLDDSINGKAGAEANLIGHIKVSEKIDTDYLYTNKGRLFELYEIQHLILHKEELEIGLIKLEVEDEN